MRFWQKIFISMLLLFILIFDISVYTITSYSYQLNLDRETDSAVREHELISSSIKKNIQTIEEIFPDVSKNNERLTAIIQPLIEYYKDQGVFLALYSESELIYQNTPNINPELLILESETTKNILNESHDQTQYMFISSSIAEYPHLTFVYARDIEQLSTIVQSINRMFVILNIVICIVLGVTIFLILRHTTRPIKQLNQTTREIAQGSYDKRVRIKSNDELGELAETFNIMADAVEKNIDHLKKAAENKQTFINDLSHEMRTPLTSVLGYSEYLQNANSSEEDRIIAAGNLHLAAQQLSNLSKKLTDIILLSNDDIEKKEINIAKLFDAVVKIMELPLSERNLTLQTEAKAPIVWGDEDLLISLLTNLVENAARASTAGQAITLRSIKDADKTIIEVTDAGCGMLPNEIAKITEPFYRVDKSRSKNKGGVGLGLTISKKIVRLHDAKLEITSDIINGTTVRIEFTAS